MISNGSCNAPIFAVNDGCYGFHNAGISSTIGGELRIYDQRNEKTHQRLMMTPNWKTPGLCWGWDYPKIRRYDPEMWVICTSDGVPEKVWESENREDSIKDSQNPIHLFDIRNTLLIPAGGVSIKLRFPLQSVMESIETDVEAASIPAWAANTEYKRYSTTADLLKQLFIDEQRNRNLREADDIAEAISYGTSKRDTHLYKILWLRCASRIIYNHSGKTLIPLAIGKLTIDITYGTVTV